MPDSMIALCPLFANLTPDECRAVSKLMHVEKYVQGETIIEEGEEKRSLWLISAGTCEVVKKCEDGAYQQLAQLEPNAVFGEMSFFRSGPHSASVIAKAKVETLVLTKENFNQIKVERPSAALKVTLHATRMLIDRLREMDSWACRLLNEGEQDGEGEVLIHHREWREFQTKLYTEWNF